MNCIICQINDAEKAVIYQTPAYGTHIEPICKECFEEDSYQEILWSLPKYEVKNIELL
jgi:hypothetical protein